MKIHLKRNIFINLLELFIILILFPLFFSKEFRYKLTTLHFYSEIKLTIKGKGNQYILSTGIETYTKYEGPIPDQLFINGVSKDINNTMIYNFTEEYNDITLIWNSPLSSTRCMFNGVKNITKVVISYFNCTILNNVWGMFANVELLTSIDLSNLDTTLVTEFGTLFENCISLISLDLSNFKTSKATSMNQMFFNCKSLIYLNLNSFTEESLNNTSIMFDGIGKNLTYCIDETKAPNITSAIQSKSSNNKCSDTCFLQTAILLIDDQKCISCNEQNISFPYKYNNECAQSCPKRARISLYSNYFCQDLNCQKYYNYNQTECLEEIPEGYFLNDSYLKTIDKCNYNYSGKCFSECINDTNNNFKCKDLLGQNKIENLTFCFIKDLCIYCQNITGYYPFYNQSILNRDTFTDCYKEIKGYFLDNDKAYKPCFNACKSCSNEGNETNNNCLECKDKYRFLNDSQTDDNNCYEECNENYYYFDSLNKYHCTEECPDGYKLIQEKNKCIDNCSKDDEYRYEFNNSCLKECPEYHFEFNNVCLKVPDSIIINKNEKEECPKDFPYKLQNDENCSKECNSTDFFNGICIINNKDSSIKDEMINNIRSGILEHTMDELLRSVIEGKKEDLIIVQENTIYTLTTSDNQKNNEQKNKSTIFLGECENKLKEHYNISINDPLLIFKIDIFENGSEYPIIEYEVYNSKPKEKLDLIYCKDTKIQINIPAKIDEENEFKYNPVSDYYNDLCFPYTTEEGTDINLKDRKNEFFDKNLSICESNCDYGGYNSELGKAICECNVKIKIPLMSEIVVNKDLLKSKFVDIKNIINLKIMKCYNILFTSEGLLYNIGSYIFMAIIFLNIILLIVFILRGNKNLCDEIYEIYKVNKSYKKGGIMNNNTNSIIKTRGNTRKKKCKNKKKKRNKKSDKKKKNNSDIKDPPKKKNINEIYNDSKIIKLSSSEIKLKISQKIINYKDSNSNNISILNSKKEARKKIKKNNKNAIYYSDYEFNGLNYSEALKHDKRTYPQYYFSLLRMKYSVIFTFCSSKDYNSREIKINLFLFIFSLYFTINSLFFNDSTMHKIFIDKGSFNFIYQIPQIIYSSIISIIINSIVTYLSLSEKSIIQLKKDPFITEKKVINLINCLKVKFFLFFVIEFTLLLLFWYYLSCFCAVYKNTQIHLIKDTLISFGLSLVYPLLLYLIPGVFRIPALRAKKANKKCLYKFSKMLQLI